MTCCPSPTYGCVNPLNTKHLYTFIQCWTNGKDLVSVSAIAKTNIFYGDVSHNIITEVTKYLNLSPAAIHQGCIKIFVLLDKCYG